MRLFARRFTVQERLGEQIADGLVSLIAPRGVAVHLEASHLCTQMRGVEEQSRTVTTFWRGDYEDPELRREFLARGPRPPARLTPVADVALVCGAGGALGSAIVAALSARGDRVVAVDRHPAGDAADGRAARRPCDLTSADEVAALWSRLAADGVAAAVGRERGRRLPRRHGRGLGARTRCASCTT